MAHKNLILAQTDTAALVSNLRGEVGEVITAWIIMRHFIVGAAKLRSGDEEKDFDNRNIQFGNLVANKLADELVGRLSELAEHKLGQLTFYFASQKLGLFDGEVRAFSDFVIKEKIRQKRNRDVSHKQIPAKLPGVSEPYLHISYQTLLRSVALALRLMKRIDRHVLGPCAPYLWKEARKRRYAYLSPPRASYMLVPHLNLTPEERILIVQKELAEGRTKLSEMTTTIDGQPASILVCKPWGVILVGGTVLALARYPLNSLEGITLSQDEPEGGSESAASGP